MSARAFPGLRTVIAALALLPVGSALAQLRVVEQAVEATAARIVLPSGVGSTLVVTRCVGCKPESFPATSRTRYLVGKDTTSLAELRRFFLDQPDAFVTVMFDSETRDLTRVIMSGSLAQLAPRSAP